MSKNNNLKNGKGVFSDKNLNYIIYFLLALFVYVFIMNAWVGDDAYITFRTVDNFVNGYGLTWNVSERVQAYTHPLWMFAHVPIYYITGNIYITTMILSFAFSFSALYLFAFKLTENKLNVVAGLILLIISKVFIDYTSSGLENPLTYFLIILFLIFYFKDNEVKKKIFILSLLTSLAALNRLDTILLFFPALLYFIIKNWKAKYLIQVIYGFIPLIIWEIFSIIYYGFPLPNTYYAKLNTGIPFSEYISQGFQYYYALFNFDPLTFSLIILGLSFSIYMIIIRKDYIKEFIIILGVFLYLLYILYIGGDFMCGRFFSAPLFVILILISNINLNKFKIKTIQYAVFVISIIIVTQIFTKNNPITTTVDLGSEYKVLNFTNEQIWEELYEGIGIADEKRYYYPKTGLAPTLYYGINEPTLIEVKQAKESRNSHYNTFVRNFIGYFGFYAGPKCNIIDIMALTDPLLARLKFSNDPNWEYSKWRIGHFYRKIPLDYIKTIETGQNHIKDKQIKEYYDNLKIVIKSSIFSVKRFKEILKLNIGYYDDILINDYEDDNAPKLYSGDQNSVMLFYFRTGNHHFLRNNYRSALNNYIQNIDNEQWIGIQDVRHQIFEKISRSYMKLKLIDSAIYYAVRGLKFSYKNDMINYFTILLAEHYIEANMAEEAKEVFKNYLSKDENNIQILNKLALLYLSTNESIEALNIWKKCIDINSQIPLFYYNIFTYYFARKEYDSAAHYAFEAVDKGEVIDQKYLDFLKKYRK